MIGSNFHTHTTRCQHAGGTDEEYIKKAIENKMRILGFSDHGPYPDNRFGLRMNYNELPEYLNTMNELKLKYENKIDLRIGLEIEYDPTQSTYYDSLIDSGFDYLALGQHIYVSQNKDFINVYFLENTKQYIEYAKTVVEGMKSGYFSFVAHPDVIFLNNLAWDEYCDQACNILIEGALTYNIPLELNANGYRRGLTTFVDGQRYPYPHTKFWEKVAQTNIKVLINADAHSPSDVYDCAMEKAFNFATQLNLNVIQDINL